MKNKILITTTNSLYGYEIKEYCGYIEASSTIGTGFLTDSSVTMADFFETKSKRIEQKLSIIKQDVIRELEQKAAAMNCNGVIGLKVDVDEISSGQAMMFMITAYATAVKCKISEGSQIDYEVSGKYLYNKIFTSKKIDNKLRSLNEMLKNEDSKSMVEFRKVFEEIIEENMFEFSEKELIKCVIYAKQLDKSVFEVLEKFNFKSLAVVFMEILFEISQDKSEILNIRKKGGFNMLCEFFAPNISLELIYTYLLKGNNYFNVIVIYPLLEGFKDLYNKNDIYFIYEIIKKLKEEYWNENIDVKLLKQSDMICVCGKVIQGNCDCGQTSRIRYNTYIKKSNIVKQLTLINEELTKLYK